MSANVTTLETKTPTMASGGRIAAIVPQTMEDAYRLAKAVCMAGMNPKGMETPEKCMIAIMRGLEVGLTPFQALDKIAIVNGRPTIWGDGALGLVRGSGLCEYVKETVEHEGDKRTATCETKRKGEREPIRRTFSVADAKKAGLWGKAGPWTQFADRMLSMRARAFCLRDGFADVLGGLYLKEELDNGPQDDTPRTMPTPPAPPTARAALSPPAADRGTQQPAEAPQAAFNLDTFERLVRGADTEDEVNGLYAEYVQGKVTDEVTLGECDAIIAAAFDRISVAHQE